ncbi:MAG TPA: ribose ABC transporter permease [Bacteroidota bacterium]|nr:ribose ABC transporter permease [Bacteroidota bacterium]
MKSISELFQRFRQYVMAFLLLVEILFFAVLSEYFLTPENLLNITLQTSLIAIVSVGMTMVIITAGIDISVGSVIAFVGVITAGFLKFNMPVYFSIFLAIVAGLFVGLLLGYFNGFFITKFKMAPFIITLVAMSILRGLAYIMPKFFGFEEGRPIWGLPDEFLWLGSGRILMIPFPTILMFLIFIVAYIVLNHTKFGRYIYAIGGNLEASRLAGIKTDKILIYVYMINGLLTALSGILLASRLSSGQPNAGLAYELQVIAAVAIGGASLLGGKGSIVGTFIGAMFIGVLRNGLNLVGVSSYYQEVILGLVILAAVLLDQIKVKD